MKLKLPPYLILNQYKILEVCYHILILYLNDKSRNSIKIIKHCEECFGEGEISSCCGDIIEGKNCLGCGKFASREVCSMCSGWGKIEFEVGSEVDIFICVVSPKYLKDLLYNSKKLGDFKTYYGVVREIIDESTVKVKVEGKRNLIEIKIEDLEVN